MNKMKKKFCLVLLLCPVFLFAATFTESKVEESSYHEEALTDSASSSYTGETPACSASDSISNA